MLRGIGTINNNYNMPTIIGTEDMYDSIIKASIIHKNVRKNLRNMLVPGVKIYDISRTINNMIRTYTNDIGLNGGIAFPPTVSVSNVMAHYSPQKNNNIIVTSNDNIKIDFGVHVNGWSVDSAFSCYFNSDHSILHSATKEALDAAIKTIGIDSLISTVGETIQEIIESYEILYKNKTYQLKVVNNLGGHKIEQYNLHAFPSIGNKRSRSNNRFNEGLYAVEPFVSILNDTFTEGNIMNNYRLRDKNHSLYKIFNNMIFSDYHLEYYNITTLKKDKSILIYPPLIGHDNDMICQYEHTMYIDENRTIPISKDDDY